MVVRCSRRPARRRTPPPSLEGEEGRVAEARESGPIVEQPQALRRRAPRSPPATQEGQVRGIGDRRRHLAGRRRGEGAARRDRARREERRRGARSSSRTRSRSSPPRATAPPRFNGLGSILLEKGKNERKTDQIREALLLFLRTALVEFRQTPESPRRPTRPASSMPPSPSSTSASSGAPAAGSKAETESEGKPDDAQARNLQRARENVPPPSARLPPVQVRRRRPDAPPEARRLSRHDAHLLLRSPTGAVHP